MYIQLLYLFFLLHYSEPIVAYLSCQDIRTFVDGHNNRRLLLAEGNVPGQPAASEMYSVIWDDELAMKAQRWAFRYNSSHNPNNTLVSGRFKTGENIYKSWSSNKNSRLILDDALTSWFNEYKIYKFGPILKSDFDPSKPATEHYTQMAWSNSTYIGCGVSRKFVNGVDYYVVCNYGPGGNIVGKKPYKDGVASNKLLCDGNCSQPYGDYCFG